MGCKGCNLKARGTQQHPAGQTHPPLSVITIGARATLSACSQTMRSRSFTPAALTSNLQLGTVTAVVIPYVLINT